KDDLDKSDFLYVPSGTIYHDKEQLLHGTLGVRKVEIQRPRLRVVREHDGSWNLSGIMGPPDLARRMPAIVIRQGTILIEDRQVGAKNPPLEIRDGSLTLLNDPLSVVTFEGSGTCEAVGTIKLHGQAVRGGGPLTLSLEAPAFQLGPELVQRLAGYTPEAAVH